MCAPAPPDHCWATGTSGRAVQNEPSKGAAAMNILQQRRHTPVQTAPGHGTAQDSATLPTWRLNLMRVGYFEMWFGLAVTKWPELISHDPWELKQGTVVTMLVAMSVLALFGLRYPQRMLPILLFEVGWKLLWLGIVAVPLWLDGDLTGATREQVIKVLWVAIVIAVVPWRHAFRQHVLVRGDRWR
jgi:hypothetical protein